MTAAGAGGGGDAESLLNEAAVRFDFSQYDDVDDMVDVNGGWGPLDLVVGANTVTELNEEGLRITAPGQTTEPSFVATIEGTVAPLAFTGEGFAVLGVVRIDTPRSTDEPNLNAKQVLRIYDLVAHVDTDFAPQFNFAGWGLNATSLVMTPDDYRLRFFDSVASSDTIVNTGFVDGPTTDPDAVGVFLQLVNVDVANETAKVIFVSPDGQFTADHPFDKTPDFPGDGPHPIDYLHLGGDMFADTTWIDIGLWNRALTEAEVDALVAHFTA